MSQLHGCPSCARHVYRDEQVCPFCHAELVRRKAAKVHDESRQASRAERYALQTAADEQHTAQDGEEATGEEASALEAAVGGRLDITIYGSPPVEKF